MTSARHSNASSLRGVLSLVASVGLASFLVVSAAAQDAQDVQDADGPPNVGGRSRPAARPPVNVKAKLEALPGMGSFDFGLVKQGIQLSHTFRMKSTGEEPVVIWQAAPSCGCLLGQITVKAPDTKAFERYTLGEPIPPGSEVALDAKVATNAKQDLTKIDIRVMTNTQVGVTMLQLKANVEPLLRAAPPFLQFGGIPVGTERTGSFNIQTTRGERVLLVQDPTRMTPPRKGVSFEFAPIDPDADGKSNRWRVDVRVGPDTAEGAGGYSLSLISDVRMPESPKLEELRAAAKARGRALDPQSEFYNVQANFNFTVLGKLSVAPTVFALGLVRPGTTVKRTVKLLALDPGFEFDKMTYAFRGSAGQPLKWSDKYSYAVRPVPGENAIHIDLTLKDLPADASGPVLGELVITTGHPEKPELVVRITGLAQAQ